MILLLTDEEMEGLDFSYTGSFKSSREVDRWVKHIVAKAQLKKVVEWGKEICPDHNDGTDNQQRRKCWRCWQALLKES